MLSPSQAFLRHLNHYTIYVSYTCIYIIITIFSLAFNFSFKISYFLIIIPLFYHQLLCLLLFLIHLSSFELGRCCVIGMTQMRGGQELGAEGTCPGSPRAKDLIKDASQTEVQAGREVSRNRLRERELC